MPTVQPARSSRRRGVTSPRPSGAAPTVFEACTRSFALRAVSTSAVNPAALEVANLRSFCYLDVPPDGSPCNALTVLVEVRVSLVFRLLTTEFLGRITCTAQRWLPARTRGVPENVPVELTVSDIDGGQVFLIPVSNLEDKAATSTYFEPSEWILHLESSTESHLPFRQAVWPHSVESPFCGLSCSNSSGLLSVRSWVLVPANLALDEGFTFVPRSAVQA